MHLRRKHALAASALALASTFLTSCGFEVATNRPYTPAAGTIERGEGVDALSAAIVADSDDAGTFIVGIANNSGSEPVTFTAMAPGEGVVAEIGEFEPIEVPPLGFADLSDPGNGIEVTGDFSAGDVLPMVLDFDNGTTIQIDVPVVTACDEFEGFDTASEEALPTEAYDCEPLEPVVHYGPDHEGEVGERVEDENSDDGETPLDTPEEGNDSPDNDGEVVE